MVANELRVLDEAACRRLLSEGYFGRLAFAKRDVPHVRPMNYAYVDGAVVLRTGPGSKLDVFERPRPALFEIDGLDDVYRGGWSVIARGEAAVVTDTALRSRLDGLPLRPWTTPEERTTWIRLIPDEISGRAFGPPLDVERR